MSGGVDAGGAWSIGFEPDGAFRCFAVVSGSCWLRMDGFDEPVQVEAGDFLVLPHGLGFRLASDLSLAPVDMMTVIQTPLNGRVLSWQGGGDCFAISGYFVFEGEHANMLLRLLPSRIHIRNVADRATMRWYLERMMKVLREPQPGSFLLGEYLAQMVLIEVLSLHAASTPINGVGWLSALADRQMNAAITAMHECPGYRWTLQELAARAGMSRSSFAQRFKQKVGISAMEYLTQWRMMRAADRLLNSEDPVSSIALSLGYESESAFSFAFRRQMGCSPRQYSRARAAA